MATFPFIGSSYVYRSLPFDCQRSVNLYPVKSETGTSKSIVAMQGTPGLSAFITLPDNPIRGSIAINGRTFFIAGNKLYETFIDRTYTLRGTLNSSTGTISVDDNGFQLCIVDGPNGYIFTLSTNVFQVITDPYFLGADTVTFLDGYFVFNKPDSQIYYISALYDGLTGDPLDFASAEGSPDNLVAVKTVHQQCWLFGQSTVQIVYNSGGADFPLTVVQGSLIQYGCAAPASVAQSANTVFWLGQDDQGNGMVWMANGYQPQRISTHAVEYAIQQYANITDAVAYTYQEDGHYWYILNFPTANTTWCFDIELQQWHERAYFFNGAYSRGRPNNHVFAYNKHLVGDYESGIIYQQSLNILSDNGVPIRRMRTAPHISDDLEYIYHTSLQIDMQTGVGQGVPALDGAFDDGFDDGFDIGSAITNPDVDPQVMLSWSSDGARTFSSERWTSAGRVGAYTQRVIWRRLGRARDRVYRVVITAGVKVFIIAAHIHTEKGTN